VRELLAGAAAMASVVAALYFLRFWRHSSDRLFALFAAAFTLMAVNHAALGLTDPDSEFRVAIYCVRLAAFFFILVAIVDKNRRR
jgi:uncharacterized membrane protein